jgi:hypothetical protein
MKWISMFSAAFALAGMMGSTNAGLFGSGGCKSCGCAEDCQPACCKPTIARPCHTNVYTYQRKCSDIKPPCCDNCCAPASHAVLQLLWRQPVMAVAMVVAMRTQLLCSSCLWQRLCKDACCAQAAVLQRLRKRCGNGCNADPSCCAPAACGDAAAPGCGNGCNADPSCCAPAACGNGVAMAATLTQAAVLQLLAVTTLAQPAVAMVQR